jgi:hypothetical protein
MPSTHLSKAQFYFRKRFAICALLLGEQLQEAGDEDIAMRLISQLFSTQLHAARDLNA